MILGAALGLFGLVSTTTVIGTGFGEDDSLKQVEADFMGVLRIAGSDPDSVPEQLLALAERAVTLADEAESDDAEYESLEWSVRIARFQVGPGLTSLPELAAVCAESLDRLVEDFVDCPKLGRLVLSFGDSDAEYLERIDHTSSNPVVRASLAWREVSRLLDRDRMGSARPDQEKELRTLLEQVQEKYAELPDPLERGTFGSLARKALFELDHLSVGKVAPDIVGEDLDGVTFKLSDDRGKVVVLDFWGHW